MGTRWVQRDAGGKIAGDFANPQPGIAEEEIDEAAPEMVQRAVEIEAQMQPSVSRVKKLVDLLVVKGILQQAEADTVTASDEEK